MIYVPPSTFEMGCTPEMEVGSGCLDDERPVHTVTLSHGYYVGTTEVTQAQWTAVMGENPSWHVACGETCPVEDVTWDEAASFANQLSVNDGLTPAYAGDGSLDLSANGYRLPTEAEWENAARAREGTAFAGSSSIDEVGWYWENTGGTTHPVGSLAPNALGVYDMSGNVREWCNDGYSAGYYDVSPAIDPLGPDSSTHRSRRGGGWGNNLEGVRISSRDGLDVGDRSWDLGVRLFKTAMP